MIGRLIKMLAQDVDQLPVVSPEIEEPAHSPAKPGCSDTTRSGHVPVLVSLCSY